MEAFREVLLVPGSAVFWNDHRVENIGTEDVPVSIPAGPDVYIESLDGKEHAITWVEYTP